MRARLSPLLPVAALLVVATAAPITPKVLDVECQADLIQCCANTYSITDTAVPQLTGLLGVVLPDIQGLVGFDCTPIAPRGPTGGVVCAQQPVCCTDDINDGLLKVGCSPISLEWRRPLRWHDGARLVSAALDASSFFPYWFE